MLRAELEKNLRRFVDHFSNVRLPAVHAGSFGQGPSPCPTGIERSSASADPMFRLASHPCKLLPLGEPKSAQLGELGGQWRV